MEDKIDFAEEIAGMEDVFRQLPGMHRDSVLICCERMLKRFERVSKNLKSSDVFVYARALRTGFHILFIKKKITLAERIPLINRTFEIRKKSESEKRIAKWISESEDDY